MKILRQISKNVQISLNQNENIKFMKTVVKISEDNDKKYIVYSIIYHKDIILC